MRNREIGVILIIIGLFMIFFPILGVIPFSLITGFIVSFIGIGLLLASIILIKGNKVMGIMAVILGILTISLGIGFIVNPGLFSFAVALFVFIAGLLLFGVGIAIIIGYFGGDIRSGIIALVSGIIFMLIAVLISNPTTLGILIGLGILITGILMLFRKDMVQDITIYRS
ncbi:MAG: DUF308 domain-containing protein [Methanobacterium sp.]